MSVSYNNKVKKKKTRNTKKVLIPYFNLSPALTIILLLCLYPIIYNVYISFTNYNMYHWKNSSFVGLQQYVKILGSIHSDFFVVLLNTIIFTVVNMILQLILSFSLAMLLNIDGLKGKGIYRTILILPWAIPGYITTIVWKNLFNYNFGAINLILHKIGIAPIDWLSSPAPAWTAITIVNLWLAIPFMTLVCLGGLQSIDKSLYEVAEIDGANFFQRMRSVTLPLLKPALLPAVILTIFTTFKSFDVIFLLTKGLAGKTDTVITYAYNRAFGDFNYSYGAAFSVIVGIILLILTSFRGKMVKSAEEVY